MILVMHGVRVSVSCLLSFELGTLAADLISRLVSTIKYLILTSKKLALRANFARPCRRGMGLRPCGPNFRALWALPFHVCCVQHIYGKLYFLSIGKERLVFPLSEIHCGAWKAENTQTTLQLVYFGFLFW